MTIRIKCKPKVLSWLFIYQTDKDLKSRTPSSKKELNNQEINWFTIFDYLEKQVKTKTWLTEESAQLYNRLMPYQTRLNSRLLNY